MNKYLRIGRITLGVLFLLTLVAPFIILSFSLVKSNAEISETLQEKRFTGGIFHFEEYGTKVRYLQTKNEGKPLLLMLHGAPGSLGDYLSYWDYEELRNNFEMVSVDRPGYSPNNRDLADISISEQAKILCSLLESIRKDRKFAIISHSYGGPVAAIMSSFMDTLCLGHIMVAPVIDPHSEEVFWYSSIPNKWPFSLVSTRDWKLASLEKGSHKKHLLALTDSYSEIKSPTIHIHGSKDWLAPPENVEFSQSKFNPNYYTSIFLEGESHFILWNESVQRMIVDNLLELSK